MIDLKKLITNKEEYLEGFKNKNMHLNAEVDEVINLYEFYLKKLNKEQKLRQNLNIISSKIKENPQDENIKIEAKNISNEAKELKNEIALLSKQIKDIASYFPNIPSKEVIVGKDEKSNKVLYTKLDCLKDVSTAKPHWETIEKNNLVLLNEGASISGTRQIIYNGKAALFIKALEKFMIDEAIKNEFNLIIPPVIVNEEALYNTSQLPKFEDDLFKINNDQYLIPTAEVPLTNLVANKILDIEKLPMKFVAFTDCFRKEAGSAGKDTRGLIRLHQFRKVELVIIGKNNEEEKDFKNILKSSKNILKKLKLPYRVVELCTGDTSFSSKKTWDLEVWMAGTKDYKEISSISNVGDFQARRMKTRYVNENNEKTLVSTHNGSGLAIDRTFAAILENYLQADGSVNVPDVLKPYLSFDKF